MKTHCLTSLFVIGSILFFRHAAFAPFQGRRPGAAVHRPGSGRQDREAEEPHRQKKSSCSIFTRKTTRRAARRSVQFPRGMRSLQKTTRGYRGQLDSAEATKSSSGLPFEFPLWPIPTAKSFTLTACKVVAEKWRPGQLPHRPGRQNRSRDRHRRSRQHFNEMKDAIAGLKKPDLKKK